MYCLMECLHANLVSPVESKVPCTTRALYYFTIFEPCLRNVTAITFTISKRINS